MQRYFILYCYFAAYVLLSNGVYEMWKLGQHLKQCREMNGLSLKQVYHLCNITDSRLSKIERGQLECSAPELRRLSMAYNINIVEFYLIAGYLTEDDIKDFKFTFKGVESLNSDEIQLIQALVDCLVKRKEE